MKTPLSFLLLFLFLLGFGQSNEGFIRDSLRRIEEIKLEKKIIKDFGNLEYESLNTKIINDIDFSKISQKNIVFCYENYSYDVARVFIDLNDANQPLNNFKNPAFNQKDFWTIKTLKTLSKKTNKNFIPILDTDKIEDITQFKKSLHYNYSRKDPILSLLNKFKKGKIKEVINEFYYFSTENNNLELNQNEYEHMEKLGKLNIEFGNYLNKIVTVKFTYNDNDETYRTYQYQNKNWVEIPTIDEYKF